MCIANFNSPSPWSLDQLTSLVLRGIPRHFRQEDVLLRFKQLFGVGIFDFVYVPWDTSRNANRGCVFVNCVDGDVATSIMDFIVDEPFSFGDSDVPISVAYAHVQGLEQNLAQFICIAILEDGFARRAVVMYGVLGISLRDAVAHFTSAEMVLEQLTKMARLKWPNGKASRCWLCGEDSKEEDESSFCSCLAPRGVVDKTHAPLSEWDPRIALVAEIAMDWKDRCLDEEDRSSCEEEFGRTSVALSRSESISSIGLEDRSQSPSFLPNVVETSYDDLSDEHKALLHNSGVVAPCQHQQLSVRHLRL